MKFSVLMSIYFKENPVFFKEAFLSVTEKQTLKPSEVVLVVDGELTPELERVVLDLSQSCSYLRVFRLKENSGLGRALHYGLEKCSYNWVARMDSDDIAIPDRFEKQISYLENYPDIAVLGSYIKEFNTEVDDAGKTRKVPIETADIRQMAKTRNPINHMSVLFNRKIILSVGSYHHIPFVEDYELWVRVLLAGYKVKNLPKILVYARVGNGMATRRSNREYLTSWRKVSQLMYENQMISRFEFIKNMLMITIFIYTPIECKKLLYKYILRK